MVIAYTWKVPFLIIDVWNLIEVQYIREGGDAVL